MENNELTRYKEMSINAMTGHLPLTPDNLYDIGKALESVCDEMERYADIEDTLEAKQEELQSANDAIEALEDKSKDAKEALS